VPNAAADHELTRKALVELVLSTLETVDVVLAVEI
jgi:hypothetical protein